MFEVDDGKGKVGSLDPLVWPSLGASGSNWVSNFSPSEYGLSFSDFH